MLCLFSVCCCCSVFLWLVVSLCALSWQLSLSLCVWECVCTCVCVRCAPVCVWCVCVCLHVCVCMRSVHVLICSTSLLRQSLFVRLWFMTIFFDSQCTVQVRKDSSISVFLRWNFLPKSKKMCISMHAYKKKSCCVMFQKVFSTTVVCFVLVFSFL